MKIEREYTDEELVTLIRNGETELVDILLDKYKSFVKVKSRGFFLIGADTDDIVQEGMIGLYKAIRDYKDDKNASFKSFASLCIDRQIITAIKTATRDKHKPLNDYISFSKEYMSEDGESLTLDELSTHLKTSGPEDEVINKEGAQSLIGKIKKTLSRFENEVLTEFLKGLSYEEIAKHFNKDIKSIDNALQRIKKKLRVKLGKV